MKAGNNFKIPKQIKRICARFTDKAQRAVYKDMMIDAQLAFERAKKEALKQKRTSGDSEE
jgi:hypothetical protein